MATQTRFKGLEGETLSQLTIKQNDMIQVRHEVGTANDSDKGLPFSVLQSIPIAVCISAASETNKTATIDNFADFELQNGREVIVYMANANTATEPTLTINGVGFAAMESGVWQAGTFIKCKYVSINVSGSQITRWLVDAGAYNTTIQLNGALAGLIKVADYIINTDGSYSGFAVGYVNLPFDRNRVISCLCRNYSDNTFCYAQLDNGADDRLLIYSHSYGQMLIRVFYI